jgi:hypothetical protein
MRKRSFRKLRTLQRTSAASESAERGSPHTTHVAGTNAAVAEPSSSPRPALITA